MQTPLVSAIMPLYNGAKTVRAAVESVLAQSYSPIEFIIVDDASTDESLSILEPYQGRVRIIARKTNSGVCAAARAEAIAMASGKYCAFIDQDDLWEPTKIARQVELMEAHPDIPLCHTYMRVIDGDGRELEVRHEGRIPASGMCARELLQHCFITASAIMVRPESWVEAKRAIGYTHANTDTETFLSLLQRHPAGFGFIPQVLGAYRRWPQSMSRQNWKWSPEDVNALDRVYAGRYWEGLLEEREVKEIIAEAYWKNAEHWRHAGYTDRSRYFAQRGLRYGPTWLPLYGAWIKALLKGRGPR